MAMYPDGTGQVNIGFDETIDDGNENNGNIHKRRKEGVVDVIYPDAVLNHDADGANKETFQVDSKEESVMIYDINESPPLYLSIFFGLQQALLSLSGNLSVSLLVAETVCAENDEEFKAKLLGTTLFMSGVTTLLMTFIGVRLPLFQGAAPDYVIPLLAMAAISKERCEIDVNTMALAKNGTVDLQSIRQENILHNTQLLQGSLILAGVIHCLIGLTGLVGFLLRFVGPVTIVPAIFLIGIYLMKATAKFAKVHWGISFMTCAISLILALYLSKIKLPVPIWTRKKKCHMTRYPYHQVFAILIAILIGWAVCGIMTATDVIPNNKNDTRFYTRTDARSYIIETSSWFYFPYPGQFGPIDFSVSVFVGFLIATFTSILDSIGDYYACASMCRVPPPPSHAVNRGIAIEGFCSALAGLLGCGHATTTYGGNIGAIGVTRVSSRQVFFVCGVIYLLFGIIGKVSAVFICIPYPVLGGALITMYGMFTGVVLSNLHAVDLTSSRNLAIIGTSIFTGLMVPHWIEQYPDELATGSDKADEILKILLGNPNMFGGVLACFLDNTVPGTIEERGIATWQNVDDPNTPKKVYVAGYKVYLPWLPEKMKQSRILKYIPFLPHQDEEERTLTQDLQEVISGALITMYGMFTGVVLSNLHAVDLTSSRNLAIIGTSIFTGLMVPHWIEQYPDELATGSDKADEILKILLGNPNMFGGVLACFLDNTVPGTIEERGIATWQNVDDPNTPKKVYVAGYKVYLPWLPEKMKQSRILKYIPFLPHQDEEERTLTQDLQEVINPDSTKL